MVIFTMTVIAVVTGLAGFVLSLWFHLSETSERLHALEASVQVLKSLVAESVEKNDAVMNRLVMLVEKYLDEDSEPGKPH